MRSGREAVAFRDAVPEDCFALSAFAGAVFVETFGALYPPGDLAAFLEESYAPHALRADLTDPCQDVWLAEAGGALIGYAQLTPLGLPEPKAQAGVLELKRLYVARAWHGAGPSEALMRWAMERARARGANAMALGVYSENVRAQRFYARYGFRRIGSYAFPVGAVLDDEWIMLAPLE